MRALKTRILILHFCEFCMGSAKIGTMNSPRKYAVIVSLFATLFLTSRLVGEDDRKHPNFILIVADDLGYGDLACYGNTIAKTPHLDRLAREGLRFTDFHSNGAMCTPTRVALLTGLYQQRFGPEFEGPLSGKTQRDIGLPLEAVTVAELLQPLGYQTGLFGKWHLGYRPKFLPTRQGFSTFVGLTSGDGDRHSQIDRSGQLDWWHQETMTSEPGYTGDLITHHAVEFIRQNRDQPFLLYVPHLAIHFPWQGPKDPVHRVQGTDYEQDKWGKIPDRNNVQPHVTAMIEALDASVGQIIKTVKSLDLAENTFVLFISDNGGYRSYGTTHHRISRNGILRGQKGELYEGGHRVPAIGWWPGTIPSAVCHQTWMTMDIMPTLLELAGTLATDLDGVSFSRVLTDEAFRERPSERTFFWRTQRRFAVRQGPWKLVASHHEPPQLFHLGEDPGETTDRSEAAITQLETMLKAYSAWETDVLKNR